MDGCAYRAADVTAVFADLTPWAGLRILASAEAPREFDFCGGGEPTGELALTAGAGGARGRVLPRLIDIALHGPTSGAATPPAAASATAPPLP